MLVSLTGKSESAMLISIFKFKPVINSLKYISLWGILLGSLIGCEPSTTSIAQIPAKKSGKNVYITGKVVHIAPLLNNAAYQVEDATGKIWVVTENKPPQLGQKVNLKSKIEYQSLPFAGGDLGDFYLIELEQLPLLVEQDS